MLMVNDSRGQDAMTISRPKAANTRRPTFDPLLVVMALGFALAFAAMVYPAFRANAMTAPGLILIFAAGATALIWLFAFGRAEVRRAHGDTAVEMLDAMAATAREKPSAITTNRGSKVGRRVIAAFGREIVMASCPRESVVVSISELSPAP